MPQIAIPIAIGLVAGAVMASAMTPSMAQSDYSTSINTTGTQPEIPVIYGKTVVGGHSIFKEVVSSGSGTKQYQAADTLTTIYSLGHGEINAIKQIYINGNPLFRTERAYKSGTIGQADIHSDYSKHVQVQIHTGSLAGGRFSLAEANSDGKWTKNHLCKGIVSICLKIKLDGDNGKIKGDNFSITALVEGKVIKDYRYTNNPLTYRLANGKESGRNPALCMVDYLTNDYYGCDFNLDEIDLASFIIAANWCDTYGLTMDGVVNQRQPLRTNLEEMLTSLGGALIESDGIIYLQLDIPSITTTHFNEDNILNDTIKVEYDNPKTYFNQLEVTWKNPANQYSDDIASYPPDIYTDERIQRDGTVQSQQLTLPYTKQLSSVDFLASKEVKKTDDTTVITFNADMDGFLTSVWDVISITHADLNFNNKLFRVDSIKRNLFGKEFGKATIKATEYSESAYLDSYKGITQSKQKVIEFVPNVNGLTFSFVESVGGLTARLTWDNAGYKVRSASVYYRIHGTEDWTQYIVVYNNQVEIQGLQSLNYDFMVINRDLFGNTSDPSILTNIDLKDETTLPIVTGLNVTALSKDFKLSWDDMSGYEVITNSNKGNSTVLQVMSGYEVTVLKGGVTVDKYLTQLNTFNYTYEMNLVQDLSRSVTFEVRIATPMGAKSPKVQVTANNKQCSVPDGISLGGSLTGLRVYWDTDLSEDFSFTEVHVSKVPAYTPSPSTLVKRTTSNNLSYVTPEDYKGWLYVRVGSSDVFGGDITYSKEYPTRVETIADRITQATSDASSQAVKDAIAGSAQANEVLYNGKWGFNLDTNGKISGMAMMNDGTTSAIGFNADTFAIYNGVANITPFTVSNGEVLINKAVIGELDASTISTGELDADRIKGESIEANKLTAEAITAINASFDVATIKDATIGFAKIKDDLQSTNYNLNSTGYIMTKDGYFEANNAYFRGTITSSFIKGAFIEGGIVAGGTDFVVTTEADNGSLPRKLCHAGRGASAAVTAGSNGWGRVASLNLASADYVDEGTTTYQLSGGASQTVAVNFNRSRTYDLSISGTINIDSSYPNRYNTDKRIRCIIKVVGVKRSGQEVVLASETVFDKSYPYKQSGGTESYSLSGGFGGYINVVKSTGTYTMGGGYSKTYHDFTYISSSKVIVTSLPVQYKGNYKSLRIQVYTDGKFHKGSSGHVIPTTHTATWTITSK